MKKQEVIKELVEHDLDVIFSSHPERTVADVIENGCVGYVNWSNKELEDLYNSIFCDDDIDEKLRDKPITIED